MYGYYQSWVSHVGNCRCKHRATETDLVMLVLVRLFVGGPNPLDEEAAVKSAMGISSLTSGFTETVTAAEPMHGLRLIIKEDVLPLSNHPKFEALAEVAKRGLLAPETWHCNRPYINLKTTIDVPPLGTVMSRTETDAWKTR